MKARSRIPRFLKRPVFLVLLMILGCIALIVGVRFLNTEIPQASDIDIQRYYSRIDAPENGFHVLKEAHALIPKRPPQYQAEDPERPGRTLHFKPEDDSLAFCFGIMRPDDDPEFIAYVETLTPYYEACLKALEHPYCALPVYKNSNYIQQTDEIMMHTVFNLWMARARFAFEVEQDTETGLQYLIGLYRLIAFCQQDAVHIIAPDHMYRILIHHAAALSETQLAELATVIATCIQELPTPEACLQGQWFGLDFALHTTIPRDYANPMHRINAWMENRMLKTFAEHIQENRSALLQQFNSMSSYTYGAYLRENYRSAWHYHYHYSPEQMVNTAKWKYARLQIIHRKCQFIVALERYRKAQGQYPDALEALCPAYLTELPLEPNSELPFGYRREGNGYILYGAGRNLVDDGGHFPIDAESNVKGSYEEDLFLHPKLSVKWF